MPEGPETRILASQLQNTFAGQNLNNIEIIGGKFLKLGIENFPLKFPLHNVQFETKGKFIYWSFDEPIFAYSTLGMAGSYGPPSKHSALKFTFDKGSIDFVDIRRFGNFKFVNQAQLNEKLASLGFDILRDEIPKDIVSQVRNSKFNNKTVAELLMDQTISSGIGSYIKSEGCYQAKILPTRIVSTLEDQDIWNLYSSIKFLANQAYKDGGATIKTFADMYGNSGKFFDKFQVYSRKIDPFGNKVTKINTKDGRSSYFVEGIQK